MEYVEGSYQPDGAGFGIPDVPHVEIMFDALNDTAEQMDVAGTESLSLTAAQHYAQGVLMSAGIVTGSQVAGTEGVFSAIGDGFKAVWEYITKTLKSIWDFFFNRDSAKDAEVAKEACAENAAELQAAAAGTQDEATADKQLNAMATAAGGEGGDKGVAEEIAKGKKGTLAEKRAAVKAALKEMPKMNKKAAAVLKKAVDAAVKAKKAFLVDFTSAQGPKGGKEAAAHMASNQEFTDVIADMGSETLKFTSRDAQFLTKLEHAIDIKDANAAIQFSKDCAANIVSLKAFSDVFKGMKGKIDKLLSTAEAKMKKAKEAKDKAELQKDIAALRTITTGLVRVSKLIEANYSRVTEASKALNHVFGIAA
jgi:hypothetical protein